VAAVLSIKAQLLLHHLSPVPHFTGEHPVSMLSNISGGPEIEFANSELCGDRVE